ncbi:MAG: M48 family metalloprotease [Dehalococcoidales bacterium]|nr:M48 family metalloprotease [Dehalococcoidales bacterium]
MWEQIKSNQIRSMLMIIAMGALLLAIGYVIGVFLIGSAVAGLIIALAVWGIMWLVALFQGDSIILTMSGAKKIGPKDHPRLYNVVEEMKIASGLEKMPDVYIIDDPALNAFATGRSPEHASVAITSGLLNKLNRDELQGVIAHEIGHIKNRDIRLMLIASIMLGAIVILAFYASRVMIFSGMYGGNRRSSSSSGGGGGAQIIIVLVGIVLMIVAPLVAQMIYFTISRKREYLADASSALYTRYPEGLASALEKLRTNSTQVKSANKATAPMYISNPFYKKGMAVNDLFATHPPLEERIRILRSMSGSSFRDYEKSYQKVSGSRVMPASALAAQSEAPIRQASPGALAGEIEDQIDRTRETSNLMWRMNKYRTINCEDCGTTLRLPPSYNKPQVRCPHCGHVNNVR